MAQPCLWKHAGLSACGYTLKSNKRSHIACTIVMLWALTLSRAADLLIRLQVREEEWRGGKQTEARKEGEWDGSGRGEVRNAT